MVWHRAAGNIMIDRSAVWIAMLDMVLAVLAVVIVAVAPPAKTDALHQRAEYFLTIEWAVEQTDKIDADADIWLLPPDKAPIFYGARQIGCITLDTDNKGIQDAVVTLADGSTVKLQSDKETISIRCLEPGHYDLGVNLYAYRNDKGFNQTDRKDIGLKVRVEIIKVNPTTQIVFAKDITLDAVAQTINVASFELNAAGYIHFVGTPLAPITDVYYQGRGHSP